MELLKSSISRKIYFSLVALVVLNLVLILDNLEASVILTTFNQGKGSLSADLRIIYRHEFWDWFKPPAQRNDNNRYDFFFTRSLVGLKLTLPNFLSYIQAQDVHMWGLPDDAIATSPAGTLGVGPTYFLHGGQENYSSTIIRQAYLEFSKFFINGLSLRGGRFDYLDSLEVTYDNPKVNWIKEVRLADRLIGPFTYSSFNRSFDGVKVAYDQDLFNVTSIITHPTQGGFENDAQKTIHDIDLATLTLTMKYNQLIPNTESRLFYFYYRDDRDVPKVDNTLPGSGLNRGDIKIHTLGMHWLGTAKTACGILDGLFWGVYQTGDWGRLDHEAWAVTVEGGYQFIACPWTPWIRAGYFISSGDKNPSDHDHETFYQLLPTARKYALFPFFNQMNNEDLFLQAIVKPGKKLAIRTDLHFLWLQEEDDRWYLGAGATRAGGKIFGYQGRPSFGDEKLGTLLDITMTCNFTSYFSTVFYFGRVFGSDVIENIYPREEDASFGFVELAFTF
ncbi:MAG: alginate export family protein [Pseudomonadota bacterium]